MGLAHGMPVWGTGGKGGGRVKLQAFDVVSVRGTVEANGERAYAKTYTPVVEWSGAAISGGGGSGGSIQLIAKRIVGNGNVNANGGGVRDSKPGGGGGGRVALIAATVIEPSITVSVDGGSTSAAADCYGASGTVYVDCMSAASCQTDVLLVAITTMIPQVSRGEWILHADH